MSDKKKKKNISVTPYLETNKGKDDLHTVAGLDVKTKVGNVNLQGEAYSNADTNSTAKSISYGYGPLNVKFSDVDGRKNKSISISKTWKFNKGGVVNMATGGLMSKPPYIGYSDKKKDSGITPYDVNTPESARKGLPQRGLSVSRTRYNKGGPGVKPQDPDFFMTDEEMAEWDWVKNSKPLSKKKIWKLNKGGVLDPNDVPTVDAWEYSTDESDIGMHSVQKQQIDKLIDKKEAELQVVDDITLKAKLESDINKLKKLKNKKVTTAALGGYMDNFQISQEEPLAKYSIGGAAALQEKYDRRKDYRAYAEGDEVIAEEEIVEEPLMAPVGMDKYAPMEEDIDAIEDEEVLMADADSVLDTSALSEAEESVVDEAMEMFPELEAIIPKIVATEFTEDGEVEGPGTGTSDSIPALLSDGEFVFTAKAVKHLGIDKLRKMMKQAEEAYDAGMINQEEDATLASEEEIII